MVCSLLVLQLNTRKKVRVLRWSVLASLLVNIQGRGSTEIRIMYNSPFYFVI